MTSKTNEQALESAIEKRLTGTCLEELAPLLDAIEERDHLYRAGNGYYIGSPNDFNPKYAIDEARFWSFFAGDSKRRTGKAAKAE